MQVLSCTSAGVLLAVCGLLLRSQALISGGRSPNFEVSDPSTESRGISEELTPIIVLLVILLSAPAILTIVLTILANSQFKKATSGMEQKAKEAALTFRRASLTFLKQSDEKSNAFNNADVPASNSFHSSQSQRVSHPDKVESRLVPTAQGLAAVNASEKHHPILPLPVFLRDEEEPGDALEESVVQSLAAQVSELKHQLEASRSENNLLHSKLSSASQPMLTRQSPASLYGNPSFNAAISRRVNLLEDQMPAYEPNSAYIFVNEIPSTTQPSSPQMRHSNFGSFVRSSRHSSDRSGVKNERFQLPRAASSPFLANVGDLTTDDENPLESLAFGRVQLPAYDPNSADILVKEIHSTTQPSSPQMRQTLADFSAHHHQISAPLSEVEGTLPTEAV